MNTKLLLLTGFVMFNALLLNGQMDYISALKDTLTSLSGHSENAFFKLHCESMIRVIESNNTYSSADSSFLEDAYTAFNESGPGSARNLQSYLDRQRKFIIAWVSPTDGSVSFSWLQPPADWNPEQEYPLYVQLHGLWSVADNPIDYLTYPCLSDPSSSFAFEDGYLLSPWGRGNHWYQGISETDLWECINTLEELVTIDPMRKYLCGHSMGGFGAWYIGSRSANTWAALGIHAGALWYDANMVTETVAEILEDVPVYFVCGTSDGLLSINQEAYGLLQSAGNSDLQFITFEGDHTYRQQDVEAMYLWMHNFENEDLVDITTPSFAEPDVELNISYGLQSSSIGINYILSKEIRVRLQILNSDGTLIETIADEPCVAGSYGIIWKPQDLPGGVYICSLTAGHTIISKKIIIF